MFDPNADPEAVVNRAAELAVEQLDRLNKVLEVYPLAGAKFYREDFEIGISNQIARLLGGYADLKGLTRKNQTPTPM